MQVKTRSFPWLTWIGQACLDVLLVASVITLTYGCYQIGVELNQWLGEAQQAMAHQFFNTFKSY